MSLREQLACTKDFFAYVVTYIGGFPAEDQMTPERALNDLSRTIGDYVDRCRNKAMKQWLVLSLAEVEEARAELADIVKVEKHLEKARSYFENALAGKQVSIDFVISPDGNVTDKR